MPLRQSVLVVQSEPSPPESGAQTWTPPASRQLKPAGQEPASQSCEQKGSPLRTAQMRDVQSSLVSQTSPSEPERRHEPQPAAAPTWHEYPSGQPAAPPGMHGEVQTPPPQ